ncbi:MAG: hypothetical protein WCA09_08735 [Burkholderiales bacterium]
MKSAYKMTGALLVLCVLSVNLAPEAHALRGRGAAFAVGAAVGSSNASSSQSSTTASQPQAAAPQQQAPAAQPQAAAAGTPLPMGTVVATLPAGCTPTPVDGVNYYYCGGNFYQAVYEGSTLKYVTTKPK